MPLETLNVPISPISQFPFAIKFLKRIVSALSPSKSSFPVLSEAHSVQVFTIIPPLKLCSSRLLLNPMDSSHLIRPNLSSIWTNRSHRYPHTTSSSSRASATLGFLLLSLAAFSFLFFLNVCIYFGCTEY